MSGNPLLAAFEASRRPQRQPNANPLLDAYQAEQEPQGGFDFAAFNEPAAPTSPRLQGLDKGPAARGIGRAVRAAARPQERNIAVGGEQILTAPAPTWGNVGDAFVSGLDDRAGRALGGIVQALPEMRASLAALVPGAGVVSPMTDLLTKPLDEVMRQSGKGLFDRASAELDRINPRATGAKGLALDVLNGVVDLGLSVAATAATKSPTVGAAIVGANVFGNQFGESIAKGRTEKQAMADAGFSMLAEFIPERLALGALMKPGGRFLTRVGKGAAAEGIQEAVTETLQAGYDAGVLNEDMTWTEAAGRVGYAGLVGGIVGGGVGGAVGVAQGGVGDADRTRGADPGVNAAAAAAMDPNGYDPNDTRQYAAPLSTAIAPPPPPRPVTPGTRPPGVSPAAEAVQALDPNGYNPGDRRGVAPPLGSQPARLGIIEQATAPEALLTPEDRASPIPDATIAAGKAAVARATAAPEANAILASAGVPEVGSAVDVRRGETSARGKVVDAFMTDAGEAGTIGGVRVQFDDGTTIEEHFDTLADMGVRILRAGGIAAPPAPTAPPGASPPVAPLPAPARLGGAPSPPALSPARQPASARATGGILGYMAKNRSAESGGNDAARNGRSTAAGRYQFTDGTWKRYYAKVYGTTGESEAAILAKKNDGAVQDRLMRALTQDNSNSLRAAGFAATDGNRYLAHFAGLGGALKLLGAGSGTSVESVLGAAAVKANPFLAGKNAGQVIAWAARKMGDASGAGTGRADAAAIAGDAAPVLFADVDWGDSTDDAGDASPSVTIDPVGDGSRVAPVAVAVGEDVDTAAARVAEPTDAQKEAGNYRKGHIKLHGLDIAIETARGAKRRGTDGNGKAWSVAMPDHYGYVKRTEGADGDAVDVYVGPKPESERVFVVDQRDAETGAFDEHKAMLGYSDRVEAMAAYNAAFSDGRGPARTGAVTEMEVGAFRDWLKSGSKAPVGKLEAPPRAVAAKPAKRVQPDRPIPDDLPAYVRTRLNALAPEARNKILRDLAHRDLTPVTIGRNRFQNEIVQFPDGARALKVNWSDKLDYEGDRLNDEGEFEPTVALADPSISSDDLATLEDMPSGKSVLVKGATPDQLDAIAAALPAQAKPLPHKSGKVWAKKHEAKIRAALAGVALTGPPAPAAATPSAATGQTPGEEASSPGERSELPPSPAPSERMEYDSSRIGGERAVNRAAIDYRNGELSLDDALDAIRNVVSAGDVAPGYATVQMGRMNDVSEARAREIAESAPGEVRSAEDRRRDRERPAPALAANLAPARGATNKLFTADAAARARALLKAQASTLNSGFNPEVAAAGLTLMGFHIEAGARSFIAAARAVATDLDMTPAALKSSLRSWYNSARDWFEDNGQSIEGMDDDAAVRALIVRVDDWGANAAPATRAAEPATPAAEVSDAENAEPVRVGADDRDGDAGSGTGDVPGSAVGGQVAGGADGSRADGDRELPDRDGGGDAAGRAGRVAAGRVAERGDGDGDRAGGRVPARGRTRPDADAGRGVNFLAPAGALRREGGWRATAERNLDIIELVNQLDAEQRPASPEEQALLAKFTGWGASEIRNNLFNERNVRRNEAGERELVPATWGDWVETSKRAAKLLRGADLETALQSTQYAHYTAEPVIRSIWAAVERLGFHGGKVLEPGMGIGLFMAAAPEGTAARVRYTGIELDGFSAKVAGYLLPRSSALHADYVKQKLPDGFFDLAIGNPPFANVKVLDDPAYKRHRLSLHDYFFAKSINKVRPGGLMVFVTSRYTMDKQRDQGRQYLADRADLLGAVRLPQTAFKENAGTEVVTDVLFFQRRAEGAEPGGEPWLGTSEVKARNGTAFMVNEYFAAHPEMVLGTHTTTGSQYRGVDYTVEPLAGDIADQIAAAVKRLPANVYNLAPAVAKGAAVAKTWEADMRPAADKEGSLYLKDGQVHRRDQGVGMPITGVESLKKDDAAWLASYVGLRDAIKQAQRAQLDEGDWEAALKTLNRAYDAHVKSHGPIRAFTTTERTLTDDEGATTLRTYRRFKNQRLLDMDVESALVFSLEKIGDDGAITKAAFLNGRTLKKPTRPVIESPQDALAVSLDELGKLDLDYIATISKTPRDQVIAALGDGVFQTPSGEWQTADEYLSGDVLIKLEEARVALPSNPDMARNIDALEGVQPTPLAPEDIAVRLGAGWVPVDVVKAFATDVVGVTADDLTYEPATAGWSMEMRGTRSGRSAAEEYGTDRRSPAEILMAVLNNQTIRVEDPVEGDSKKKVLNPTATAAAVEAAKKMTERFRAWVWEDAARAGELSDLYNTKFNNLAPRRFDGSHLTLPGLSTRYTLYPHQKRAIWRVIQTGNTYLAHAVGAGKTLEMIVSAMEQRRLGLIKKPMFAIPNHMLNQFASEFLDAYPAANIMVADEKAFHTDNRRRFMAQASLNDPDAIIVTHSSFGKLQTKPETRELVLNKMVAELEAALEGAEARHTRSKIENQIESLKRRFGGATAGEGKDNVLYFEDMGVDFVYVDEAHEFRKLDYATSRQVKGIDPKGSQRSLDLYIKTRWLEQQRPGRSLVLASGTPVTNTMAELFTVTRFMDETRLEDDGLRAFDAWANMFGEVAAGYEQNAAGGYEVVERFAKFVNVPELMKRVRSFMDVLTGDQLGDLVKRPAVNGGVPHNMVTPPIDSLAEYMASELSDRIETTRKWKPSKAEPNNPDPIIAINGDALLASIDMRFIRPGEPSDPGSKLNKMIDQIVERRAATKDLTFTDPRTGRVEPNKGGTQIVFSAVGFGEQAQKNRGFDLRGWVNKRLMDAGLKKPEIAWMGDADTHAKKEQLFKDMRAGKVKVLFGSPKNMGTGVNVQNRLAALHYLSPPWFPSDVEQPHGRIIRQGNWNESVDLYWYATKGTYDSTAWGMVSRKARFIEQALKGDDSVRAIEDVSEANQYEMAAALAAGDDRLIKVSGLTGDIERLSRLRTAHAEEQRRLRQERPYAERAIERYRREVADREAAVAARDATAPFGMTVNGTTFDKQGEAGAALLPALRAAIESEATGETVLATYAGKHKVLAILDDSRAGGLYDLVVRVGATDVPVMSRLHKGEDLNGLDPVGLAGRVHNAVGRVPALLRESEAALRDAELTLIKINRKAGAPFPQAAELNDKVAEKATLQADLAAETAAADAARASQPKQSRVDEEPVAVLTGEELGKMPVDPALRVKIMRDRAINWYASNLAGKTVTSSDGLPVTFGRAGQRKSTSAKGDILLRAVPAISAIIERGKRVDMAAMRPEMDGIFYAATVKIGDELHRLGVVVRQDSTGRFQYDLTRDTGKRSVEPLVRDQRGTRPIGLDGEPDAGINLVVLGPEFNGDPFSVDTARGGDHDAVRRDLEARLKQLGVADRLRLVLVDRLAPGVSGQYHRGTVTAALASTQDPRVTIDHEVIHFLREEGLFRDAEWTTLLAAARADGAMMASVRRRYPDLSDEAQIEEAVADRFARWAGGADERGFAARAFERIRDVLRALGEALRGNGFTTADSVMRTINRGEVGSRAAREAILIERAGPRQSVTTAPTAHEFADGATEERWTKAAEGLGSGDSMLLRVRTGLDNIVNGFARHWEALPNLPKYAGLQQKLRAIEAAPQAAKERAVRQLSDMVKGFTRADLDLLARKVVLDDLIWEADQDHDLPFGLTPDTLRAEKARVDAIVQAQPDQRVWKAAMKRKVINRQVANELVAVGVLEADRVKNPAYFRHQVLDYARTEARLARGANRKLKSPKWARRMGSSLDINANLLEAEFDWLNKAMTDIPVARTITWIKDSEHNILTDLQQKARDNNAEKLRALIAVENDPEGEVTKAERDFRVALARGFSIVRKAAEDGDLDGIPKQFEAAVDAIVAGKQSDGTFGLLSWILDNDEAGAGGAAMVLKAIGQRRAFRARVLGRDHIDPGDAKELVKRLAPEGYATWAPDESKLLFTVKTLPEHVIDGMIAKIDSVPGIDPVELRAQLEKARTALAMGGDRYTMILPQEVVDTLNRLKRDDVEGIIGEALAIPVRAWKRWVLINPRRVIKYNLNNLSGDLDAVLAGNPRLLRRTAEAAREVAAVMRDKAAPSARYQEAIKRGVFDSGLSIQEIPEINRLSAFAALATPTSNRPDKLAALAVAKVWRGLQGFTQWRENVFRYAAYLDYADRIAAGESMDSIGYGASVPAMVDAVVDENDRAALLARDLIGDYGSVSENGQWMRSHLVPFWSWMEVNTKRYWRLTSNAYTQGVGKGVATGGALALAAGARGTAWLTIRMMMVYGLINLWNWMLFDDEEDELSAEQRRQLHIILGRNDAGEVVTLRTQGAFSDAMAWFGLGDAAEGIKNYEAGRGGLAEVAAAPFKATINRVGTSLSPMATVPLEAATGKKLWPDLFATRINRDPWRNLFSTFSLENEYDAATGAPSRGYGRSWIDSTVYRRQPGEIAYDESRGLAYDWLRREKGSEGSSDFSTPRSEAARRYRTALRYGDEGAAEKALDDMGEFGVTEKDLDGMLKRAEPLGPIAKKDRARFLDQLTDEELAKFERAQAWYEATFR